MDSRFGYCLRHMHPCAFVALRRRWAYANQMTRTHEKVSHSPESERIEHTPISAAQGIEQAFKFVEGRWKLMESCNARSITRFRPRWSIASQSGDRRCARRSTPC